MPRRADMSFSEPGAPGEPQRTRVTIGLVSPELGRLVSVAAELALYGQEALEPVVTQVSSRAAVPSLVSGTFDVAIVDAASFIGERVSGWDGVAIAAFGPLADDRSVGMASVERDTWRNRRDTCERLVRAWTRALEVIDASGPRDAAPDTSGWWPDCRPSAVELSDAIRWEEGDPHPALTSGLAWLEDGHGRSAG